MNGDRVREWGQGDAGNKAGVRGPLRVRASGELRQTPAWPSSGPALMD